MILKKIFNYLFQDRAFKKFCENMDKKEAFKNSIDRDIRRIETTMNNNLLELEVKRAAIDYHQEWLNSYDGLLLHQPSILSRGQIVYEDELFVDISKIFWDYFKELKRDYPRPEGARDYRRYGIENDAPAEN